MRTEKIIGYLHILAQFDGLDLTAERKFSNAFQLMVVPKHNFIGWPLGAATSADKGQDVASVEHLNNSDASIEF